MMKIKILFLIHDLGHGGAEKVLVNLVNNLDKNKFDVTVLALFGGGVNEQFIASDVTVKTIWEKPIPGNSRIMKLFSPQFLHKLCVKDDYDIEVSYLEGPSARIVSGCTNSEVKKICWIHSTMASESNVAVGFRNLREAIECYSKFDKMLFVSKGVRDAFETFCGTSNSSEIAYNTNESDRIIQLSKEKVDDATFMANEFKIVSVGKITKHKGFDKLARITKRLQEDGIPAHLYALGTGPLEGEIRQYLTENGLSDYYTFLGYQTNPYKYISKCDLFVCASKAEGFSTATTEALILGIPVCTVRVSGMDELLGENEYGIITENSEEALYQGIKKLLDDPELLAHYKKQAEIRGKIFSTENTVKAVEKMLLSL
jgi:glycosyltransferase involved in cell wall biosynthesis